MLAFTHTATGVFAALTGILILRPSLPSALLLLAGGLVGSLLPDIDHPKSWIGRRIPIISIPLSSLVGHRGVTHSLMAVLLTLYGSISGVSHWGLVMGFWSPLIWGLCLGYVLHLLGDWASNSGIPVFWPSKRRYKSPITFMTGCAKEKMIAWALWIGSALMAFHSLTRA